ncbi:MAG: hypothetical protein IKC31_01470 [Clostridia bacterium]|nr:hypothetical protein [Clostridia bacterium]MBR2926230.1 hypothetical protein [Clostridia bacterium]
MKVERKEVRVTVREGYQILLRGQAEWLCPIERPRMRDFYERLVGTCMRWAEEVHGEHLRKEFLNLESVREKSRFRTQQYRFLMRVPWEDGQHASVVCESELTGQWHEPQKSYYRTAQMWNLAEELILPMPQILGRFGGGITKQMLPFSPDGLYFDGNALLLFRNPTEQSHFVEERLLPPPTEKK